MTNQQATPPTDAEQLATLRTANGQLHVRLAKEEELKDFYKGRRAVLVRAVARLWESRAYLLAEREIVEIRVGALEKQIAHLLAEREISDLMHDAQIQERDAARAEVVACHRGLDAQARGMARASAELDVAHERLHALTDAARAVVESEHPPAWGVPGYTIVLGAALRELERCVCRLWRAGGR